MAKSNPIQFDKIGYWSEIKLDIVKDYATAYSTILANKRFSRVYIDGFAGSGIHLSKATGEFVPGSPVNALSIQPPFDDYFLIDLDGDRVDQLRKLVGERRDIHVLHGDCNRVLLEEVFPAVRYEDYRRGLCLLDPYGLHLNWQVLETAGRMRSIEIFLNFPIMDMNRNALWSQPERVSPESTKRMTLFWGDESWRQAAYREQTDLFGEEDLIKRSNEEVVAAFRERLKKVAGFAYVSEPLPMRNSNRAVVYYLIFASQQPVADKIVRDIFDKYKNRGI